MSLREIVLKNNKKKHQSEQEFFNVFGVSLSSFFDPIFGFNIIAFDEEVIKPSANESTKDKILRKYGEKGVECIKNLL